MRWHPAPGEWCVNEVLGHLIEADRRGFAGRVEVLLESDHPELLGWDQEVVAGGRRDCERDAAELLEELLGHRERGLRMLDGLTAAEMARSGRHPKVGELSVGDVVNEWIHHDRNHLKQILSNLQAYVGRRWVPPSGSAGSSHRRSVRPQPGRRRVSTTMASCGTAISPPWAATSRRSPSKAPTSCRRRRGGGWTGSPGAPRRRRR